MDGGLETHAGFGLYVGEGLIKVEFCIDPKVAFFRAHSIYSAGVGNLGGGGRGSMGGPCYNY